MKRVTKLCAGLCVLAMLSPCALGQGEGRGGRPEYPPFKDVAEGYERVVSTVDGQSFYALWIRKRDGQILAELPRGWQSQRHFIAGTIAGGHPWAGLHSGYFYSLADRYFYWKQYDNRLAMIAPQTFVRSTGDPESRSGVARHFTDRVLLDVPIVCMGPNGNPVIDVDDLLIGGAQRFFGSAAGGINARLATIKQAKAFPENVEITFEAPAMGGQLLTYHYSISLIPDNTGYRPRKADERVGYFTTTFRDLGKFRDDEVPIRYINRWKVEKRDPSLKLSPPKEPIVFYIEHTVPVRYRRWVKQGIEYWNDAFRAVGIDEAIQVHYQDKETGAHMEKDPADVRYNFILWLSNDQGTAVGPSRVHPLTGQILDADVVLTDGWIRYFWYQYNDLMPEVISSRLTPETLAWLESRPHWDPRVLLAPPAERPKILAQRAQRGVQRYGGHPAATVDNSLMGDDRYDGLFDTMIQRNGMCMAPMGKAMDMARMGMVMQVLELLQPGDDGEEPEEPKPEEPKKPDGDTLDGIPDWFVGPLLADLVAHEVGHTLGLRHNFKASSIYSLAQINSEEFRGKKPFTGSVMDYNPVNFNMDKNGSIQGDFSMIDIGPYDRWAIEYGYTTDDRALEKILARVAEPELAYGTDEDTWGPDPLTRQYDFTSNPMDYAKNQIELSNTLRAKILERYVKDGEAWSRARRGYNITFFIQSNAVAMMTDWIGGAYITRDRKGDPNGRPPVTPVEASKQREALEFIADYAFKDDSFGLTPELLQYMARDTWTASWSSDHTFPVHDRIMGFQASVLTMLLNPTTLRGVYDNEVITPTDQDALTLPELMETITAAVWTEVMAVPAGTFTARKPMISSLRRNLQRSHMERLFDLAGPGNQFSAAYKPISNIAVMQLRQLSERIGRIVDGPAAGRVDPYSKAHLSEAKLRIDKVLDAQYVYNQSSGAMALPFFFREVETAVPSEPWSAPEPTP